MDLLGGQLRADHLPMDRLSRPAGPEEDLPVVADAATAVGAPRRWAADPLPLMLLLGGAGLALATLTLAGAVTGTTAWLVPALFAVVVAGLALSGST